MTGKKDFERGATARLTFNLQESLILLHDSRDGGQTNAGSFTGWFGRKERLKNSGLRILIHTGTGVSHRQHDKFSGKSTWVRGTVILIEFQV